LSQLRFINPVIMKAVIIKEHGTAALADIKEQAMRPDYIKVKTVALGLNPTDLHHTAGAGRVGGIIGCDFSGIVEEVGKECRQDLKKGDHVYGVAHCANLVCANSLSTPHQI
jgi:NADPH:quinone reductase-like Zn-dependent oxidoreductase